MTQDLINQLRSPEECRELRYHFHFLKQWYETKFGGPRGAMVYKEYFVLRDAVDALYKREVHLQCSIASVWESMTHRERVAWALNNVCNNCDLAREGRCPQVDKTVCSKVKEAVC